MQVSPTNPVFTNVESLVVKVGSSLVASATGGLDTVFISRLVGQLAALRERGKNILLVSSGAVAAGLSGLGLPQRPSELPLIQAAAAVGQVALMQIYRQLFKYYNLTVAQILLTRDNLQDRRRFLHARNTILTLMKSGIIPIVNENDPVAVEELNLKLGDNDFLAVSAAQLADAGGIVILSDVDGLYDRPPGVSGGKLVAEVRELTPEVFAMAGVSESGLGSGGMLSKLNAARAAGVADIPLLIANGRQENVLLQVLDGKPVGTLFLPHGRRESSYRQWLSFGRSPDGVVRVDAGAKKALSEKKKSLLPIGVKEVEGEFGEGDTVAITDLSGQEFARGLSNFTAGELRKIMGVNSRELVGILGRDCDATVVHRDNLVVLE